jgi:hypothetical protein
MQSGFRAVLEVSPPGAIRAEIDCKNRLGRRRRFSAPFADFAGYATAAGDRDFGRRHRLAPTA